MSEAATKPLRVAPAQLETFIAAAFETVTGKRIHMHYTVDASLIGGIVAHFGSTVYDGSVRGQLATLERRLATES